MDTKPTNPKDAVAVSKAPLSIIPSAALAYLAWGLQNGADKYGKANWRKAGVRGSIYLDAAIRHLVAWNEGEAVDPDDGVPNLAGALASLAIYVDALENGFLENDDRPTPLKDPRGTMNKVAKELAALRERRKVGEAMNPKLGPQPISDEARGFLHYARMDAEKQLPEEYWRIAKNEMPFSG